MAVTRVGIDLGGTKIEGVGLDEAGEVVARRRVATRREEGYEAILERIARLAHDLGATAAEHLGICTPGSLSPRTGLLRNSNTVCFNGKPFRADLERLVGRGVEIENDANCFALAEALRGAGRGYRTLFGVILGTGVGGGIVIDGLLHTGRLRIEGEWGHHTLHPGGRECYCGRRGCVETYLSGPALEARWRALSGEERVLAAIVADAEGLASQPGKRWRRELLADFGLALGNVVNILDPDAIVLGGGVSNVAFLYKDGVEALRAETFSDFADTPVLPNELGDSAGVFGAAYLAGRRLG